MSDLPTEREPDPPDTIDDATLLARAAASGIMLPPDRRAAVLDGARHLATAARLLRDALPGLTDDEAR